MDAPSTTTEQPAGEPSKDVTVTVMAWGVTSAAGRRHYVWSGSAIRRGIAMPPAILIIEPRREIADALEEVVSSANYLAVVRPHLDRLSDLGLTPAAIIVRITFEGLSDPPHAAIERWPMNRPPVVAIAWEDAEIREAERLHCEVVLHAPDDVGRLCDALSSVVR